MNTLFTGSGACRGIVGLLAAAALACSNGKEAAPPVTAAATPAAVPSTSDAPIPPTTSPYDALPEAVQVAIGEPFTGDFDALVRDRRDAAKEQVGKRK